MTDYQYHTKPYPHQEREFIRSRDHITWAFFLEQRTGKCKLSIDTAAYNWERGKIDAMLIIAPPGVHAQWLIDEVPKHMPARIPWQSLLWRTGRAPKTFTKTLKAMIDNRDTLAIMALNTQALITDQGKAAVKAFLTGRKVLFIFDESADIRTPSAQTTRMAVKFGKMAVMRRILAGVPAPEGPMGLYSQYRFLHPRILGAQNFHEYKLTYGEWEIRERGTMRRISPEQAHVNGRLKKGMFMLPKKDKDGKPIYKNLDLLEAKMAIRTSRVTQREAFPHMPEKQYQRFYVDMAEEQVKIYNQLAEEYEATLDNRTLTVKHLLTRFLRMQQVICGYLPMPIDQELPEDFDWFESGGDLPAPKYEIVRIPGAVAPRMAILDEILRLRDGDPVIIWARFKPDIDLLMQHFEADEISAMRYDGSVKQEERDFIKHLFQQGKVPVLVGNQKAGGTGLTLKPAQTVVYYSNYFGLLERLQSEDRPIHGELIRPVLYADLVARTTLEEQLVNALQFKRDLFEELMGDRQRIAAWFRQAA